MGTCSTYHKTQCIMVWAAKIYISRLRVGISINLKIFDILENEEWVLGTPGPCWTLYVAIYHKQEYSGLRFKISLS